MKFIILGCGSSMGVPRPDGYFGKCDPKNIKNHKNIFGCLLQYPDTLGHIDFNKEAIEYTQGQGGLATLACDPLSLTLLKSPGEIGADIAVGSCQRFGCSLSYGGPHAAFLATKDAFFILIFFIMNQVII